MTTTYQLIIADDHKMFLDGLLSILDHEPDYNVVLTAHTGKNVIKYLDINKDDKIDLVITDINMPDVDGVALNHYIKKHHKKVRTLVVSMLHDPEKIQILTEDDVDGYVPKNAEKTELLLAIKTILKGNTYFSESIKTAYMKSVFDKKKETKITLTQREKDVLTLIAKEYTTQEIAEALFLSKHTIEGYRKNLISKLDVRNLAGLTKYAIKLGLVDE